VTDTLKPFTSDSRRLDGTIERPVPNPVPIDQYQVTIREGSEPTARKHDRYGHLTITDLQLIARGRGLDLPEDAERDAVIALLDADETPDDLSTLAAKPKPKLKTGTRATTKTNTTAVSPRSGWWTSLSVRDLRCLAREHGIEVPAGICRHELVELLVNH